MGGPAPPGAQRSPLLQWLVANRQQLMTGVGAVAATYVAWRAYRSESAAQVSKLAAVLRQYASAAGSLGGAAALVASDLQAFLTSDADEVPQSLRQLNKLLQCPDVQATVSTTTTSITKAIAATVVASTEGGAGNNSLGGEQALRLVLDAVLSDRGHSLVGMAVGLATKNATATFCEYLERMQGRPGASAAAQGGSEGDEAVLVAAGSGSASSLATMLTLLASEQGEKVLSLLVTKSIRTAVSTYVDATTGYNVYQDMMASITNQEHRDAVSDVMSRITAAFCRELVTAYNRATQRSAQHAQQRPGGGAAVHHGTSTGSGPTGLLSSLSASSSSSSVVSLTGHMLPPLHPSHHPSDQPIPGKPPHAQPSVRRRHSYDDSVLAHGGNGGGATAGHTGLTPANAKPCANGHTARVAQNSAGGAALHAGPGHVLVSHHGAPWLQPLADLAREKDVRSLAVDLVRSATREAARGTWEAVFNSASSSLSTMRSSYLAGGPHVYALMTLCVSLLMYAVSPRVIVV